MRIIEIFIYIYMRFCYFSRQNLNSDFTDSALGSAEKSPLPYGNFQLRDSTVQSILRHPRYGPKSPLANNSYTYLKFGLPRVLPPSSRNRDGSSGYDSSEEGRRVSHAGTDTCGYNMEFKRIWPIIVFSIIHLRIFIYYFYMIHYNQLVLIYFFLLQLFYLKKMYY